MDHFDHRPSLLELPERRDMYPHHTFPVADRLVQPFENTLAAVDPQPCLGIPMSRNLDSSRICRYA